MIALNPLSPRVAMKARIDPLLAIHHYGNRHDVDEASRTAASVLSVEQKARARRTRRSFALRHADRL